MDYSTSGKRLGLIIKKTGKSDKEFADSIGMAPSNLSSYVNDKLPLGKKMGEKIIKVYKWVNLQWLLFNVGEMENEQKSEADYIPYSSVTKFPIYSHVYCGAPASQWNVNDVIDYFELPKLDKKKEPFGLIAKGDSMAPYINSHDLLVCIDDENLIKPRTAVVVVFKSVETIEANAKLIKYKEKNLRDNKVITLYSVNSKYEPEDYSVKEIVRIYKVVKIVREVK